MVQFFLFMFFSFSFINLNAMTPVKSAKIAEVKKNALYKMLHLQGWCSNEKAEFLIDLIALTQPKKVVEIGVFGGKSLIPMACAVEAFSDKGIVYGIDPWSADASAVGMEDVNATWWKKVNYESILSHMMGCIHAWGLQSTIKIIRKTSADADPIPDIDLIHIDGNHSDEASLIDVTKWVPLLKRGGLIIFDDINWSNSGIAVNWLNANCIPLAEVRGDNVWGIWVKN